MVDENKPTEIPIEPILNHFRQRTADLEFELAKAQTLLGQSQLVISQLEQQIAEAEQPDKEQGNGGD